MIFESLNQISVLLKFIFFIFLFFFIYIIFCIIFIVNCGNFFKKLIFNSIFYSFFAIFLVFLLIYFYFGKFSLILILISILFFYSLKKLTYKSVVFLENKWYNIITKKIFRRNKNREQRKEN